MHYNDEQAFDGGTALDGEAAEPYRAAADAACAAAVPFPDWWQDHQHYWRANRSTSTQ